MMNPNIQLGVRLQTLYELILDRQRPTRRYDQIWDCCCDHGYLGRALLSADCCEQVIFVDQVPHIMDRLADRLRTVKSGFQLITGDAGKLPLASEKSQLVILAGVGGEQLVEMLIDLETLNPGASVDYLLCPVNHTRALRQYLHQNPQRFKLFHERILCDRGRFYEVLFTTYHDSSVTEAKISLSGEMWDFSLADHQTYHAKLLRYYRARLRNDPDGLAAQALKDYQSLNSITASDATSR